MHVCNINTYTTTSVNLSYKARAVWGEREVKQYKEKENYAHGACEYNLR